MTDLDLGPCQCCEDEPAIGVAAVPGIPMSIAWGKQCLDAGAIPYKLAVINTALVGGYDKAAEWWQEVVDLTIAYFKVDKETFLVDVEAEINDMATAWRARSEDEGPHLVSTGFDDPDDPASAADEP